MVMNIGNYSSQDLQEIINLYIRVFNSPQWKDKWTPATADQHLGNYVKIPTFLGFVGKEGDKLLAVCFGYLRNGRTGTEYVIDELFVEPERQNQGLGSELIAYVKAQLSKLSVKSISLITDRKIPANDFFDKQGFASQDTMVVKKIEW
jgi:ribosomal protein S18 acetylase RimI-like enzyme